MTGGTSQVDFEAALQDPQAFFAEPQDVADFPKLSREESLRYCAGGNRTPFACQHRNQRVWVAARRTCSAE